MDTFSFSQCVSVLFARAPALTEISEALERWPFAGHAKQAAGHDGWAVSAGGFVYDMPGGGYLAVDVLDRRWPDEGPSPGIRSAWSQGAFGRASTPGALARASDQSWMWPGGAAAASSHKAVVRFRSGFAAQEEGEEKAPKRDLVYELAVLTELAQPILAKKSALAFFVPGGEALRSREQVDASLRRKAGSGPPPFELWTNVRSVTLLRDKKANWLALDVVGMRQLGLPDVEAIFAAGEEDPEVVERLLRDSCLHLVAQRPVAAGSTSDDGKGRRWKASHEVGLIPPQRPVVRWLPEGSSRPSGATFATLAAMAGR